MIIKEKFKLLKDIPNITSLSNSVIRAKTVPDSFGELYTVLKMMEKRIDHFTKDKVYKLLDSKTGIHVVKLPDYPLYVSYNKSTKSILINLDKFGVREITPTNPNPRDLYGCIAYGICLSSLYNKKVKIPDRFSSIIVSYLLSVFIRVFGKEYGLLGYYSNQIVKLKFLLAVYIYHSFFGVKKGIELYKMSSIASAFDYRDIKDELDKIDFSDVTGLIKALSDLGVMPGIGRYAFTSKILRFLTVEFIPAVEDLARFMALMITSNVPGITFVPSAYYRYNETEFSKILVMAKAVFQ